MTRPDESARDALIQRLHKAARIERAEAIRKLARTLMWGKREERAWPEPAQPAVSNCR